jgi:hypothetical protein
MRREDWKTEWIQKQYLKGIWRKKETQAWCVCDRLQEANLLPYSSITTVLCFFRSCFARLYQAWRRVTFFDHHCHCPRILRVPPLRPPGTRLTLSPLAPSTVWHHSRSGYFRWGALLRCFTMYNQAPKQIATNRPQNKSSMEHSKLNKLIPL